MRILLPPCGRELRACPVPLPVNDETARHPVWQLTPDDGSPAVVAQVVQAGDGPALTWVVDWLPTGRSRTYEATPLSSPAKAGVIGVQLRSGAPESVDVLIDGEPFTIYHYGKNVARPYFYPVVGPFGRSLTRHFPMSDDVPGESHDHPHHRSLWVAHGDVCGVDNWSEGQGHGRVVTRGGLGLESGPVLGGLQAENEWGGADGTKVCEERRRVTFYATGRGARVVDFEVRFQASEGELRFGDTKEGGILSVRVAGTLSGAAGGVITNGVGGRGEAECWGKRAPWCDYSGIVGGDLVGLAIFDHPANFRHPTYWHVRDYGLMTANPFGLSYFLRDETRDGSLTLPAGSELTFRYRLCCHAGEASGARVAEQYLNFAFPPRAQICDEG